MPQEEFSYCYNLFICFLWTEIWFSLVRKHIVGWFIMFEWCYDKFHGFLVMEVLRISNRRTKKVNISSPLSCLKKFAYICNWGCLIRIWSLALDIAKVHDELVLEADPSVAKEAGLLLQMSMENAVSLLGKGSYKTKYMPVWILSPSLSEVCQLEDFLVGECCGRSSDWRNLGLNDLMLFFIVLFPLL